MGEHILTGGRLLDYNGNLYQCGYSDTAVLKYSRLAVGASDLLIKEWDSYTVISPGKHAFCASVADCGSYSVLYVELCDFSGGYVSKSMNGLFPLGSLLMPSKPECGEVTLTVKGNTVKFSAAEGTVGIQCLLSGLEGEDRLSADITLSGLPEKGLFTALPFDCGRKYFISSYCSAGYNVSGSVSINNREFDFGSESFCIYNRMRGVLPHKCPHFFAAAYSEEQNIVLFFNNTGANTESASENGLIYNGKLYKTGNCRTEHRDGKTVFTSDYITAEFIPETKYGCTVNKPLSRTKHTREFGTFSGSFTSGKITFEFNNISGSLFI